MRSAAGVVLFAFWSLTGQAIAEDQAAPTAASSVSPGATQSSSAPGWAGDLETRSNLLGDIGGLRQALDRAGIAFGLAETTEVLANPVGGSSRRAIVEGVTQASLGADLSKSLGWEGALFNVSAFQIHGRGLTPTIGALDVISSIEADPSTRLNEIWLQQSVFDGRLDIKLGQQSADLEFITSEYEDLFINSGFGWPTLPAVDLPSGGPAYPLPTPGIRLRAKPSDAITTLVGLYNGSPAGLRPGDPQRIDGSGTRFDVSSGYFAIGEVQYAINHGEHPSGLPGTYKLGAWYNSNRFGDALYANGDTAQPPGVLLGIPRSVRGDWSVYGTLDQLVYRAAPDSDGGLALTARAMGAPADRNLVDLFIQGGATYKGAFGRDNDTMGIGVEWARIGARARLGDALAGLPARSGEAVIEATYQAQIEPWWQLQPDLQVIVNPGGGVLDPDVPDRRLGTAAVLGLRSIVTF
jgi:porin